MPLPSLPSARPPGTLPGVSAAGGGDDADFVEPPWVQVTQHGAGGTRHCQQARVRMGCPTQGATIYYTVDGTLPTAETGQRWDEAAGLCLGVDTDGEGSKTIRAVAEKDGMRSCTTEFQVVLERELQQVQHPVAIPLARIARRLQLRTEDLQEALRLWAEQRGAEQLPVVEGTPVHSAPSAAPSAHPPPAASLYRTSAGARVERMDRAPTEVVLGRDLRGAQIGQSMSSRPVDYSLRSPAGFDSSSFAAQMPHLALGGRRLGGQLDVGPPGPQGMIPLGPSPVPGGRGATPPPGPPARSPGGILSMAHSHAASATSRAAGRLAAGEDGDGRSLALCPSAQQPGMVDVVFPLSMRSALRKAEDRMLPPPVRIVEIVQGEDGTPFFIAEYVRPMIGWLVLVFAAAGLSSKAAIADRYYPESVSPILKSSWMTFWCALAFLLRSVWDLCCGSLAGEQNREEREALSRFLFAARPCAQTFDARPPPAPAALTGIHSTFSAMPRQSLHSPPGHCSNSAPRPRARSGGREELQTSFGTFGRNDDNKGHQAAVLDALVGDHDPPPRPAGPGGCSVPCVGLLSVCLLGLLNCMFSIFFLAALRYTSLAQTVVFINLHPALVALSRRNTMLIEYIGVGILIEGTTGLCVASKGEPAPDPLRGDLLAFCVSIFVCAYLVLSDRIKEHCPVAMTLFISNGASWLIHLAVGALLEPHMSWTTDGDAGVWGIFASHWPASVAGGLFGGALAYGGFQFALRYVSPLDVSVSMCLEPLFSVAIGILIGLPAPPAVSWLFIVVIVTGAYVVLRFGEHENNKKKVAVGDADGA